MDRLLARVRRTIRDLSLPSGKPRFLVALSGGADSMALLHLLGQLEREGECRVAGIAHLNHGLRGAAADEDEAFCRSVAAGMEVQFESGRVDVADLSRRSGVSCETAGHSARYTFLEAAAARLVADFVALGHTRDDQAETFLLRLMRGAGPRGLGGMHPRAGIFVRPLLDCDRAEVRAFVALGHIDFREDATNADRGIPRNRLRHEVMPQLKLVQPAIVRVLDREAAIARDDGELLDRLADEAFARVAVRTSGPEQTLELNVAQLVREPRAIARRIAWKALATMAAGRPVGFEHVEMLLDLVKRSGGSAASRHLPAQVAERRGDVVVLRRARGREPARGGEEAGSNSFRFSLSIPGEVVSPAGWAVSAERGPAAEWWPPSGCLAPSMAIVDASPIDFPCWARSWQPGDRMRAIGLGGSKKLQDLFVDRKVPRGERSRVPIIVDSADRVIWVAGYATSADFAVSPGTRDVVILKLRYWRNGT